MYCLIQCLFTLRYYLYLVLFSINTGSSIYSYIFTPGFLCLVQLRAAPKLKDIITRLFGILHHLHISVPLHIVSKPWSLAHNDKQYK